MNDNPNLPRRINKEKRGWQEVIRKGPTKHEVVPKFPNSFQTSFQNLKIDS